MRCRERATELRVPDPEIVYFNSQMKIAIKSAQLRDSVVVSDGNNRKFCGSIGKICFKKKGQKARIRNIVLERH
jgi:hypothetical protein